MGNMCCKRRIIQGDMKDPNSLAAARGQLWSATPNVRDNKSADPAMVTAMVNLYTAEGGNLDALAKKTGVNAKTLKGNPPKDAKDFAQKLVTGAYS
eukprot:g11307.t1